MKILNKIRGFLLGFGFGILVLATGFIAYHYYNTGSLNNSYYSAAIASELTLAAVYWHTTRIEKELKGSSNVRSN